MTEWQNNEEYARPYNKRARMYTIGNDGKAFVLGHKRTTSHNANSFSLKRSKQSKYYYVSVEREETPKRNTAHNENDKGK